VLLQPEDGRSLLGLVAAEPLKDGGAVVNNVGQDVDLGVLVGDELSVEPDVGLHTDT